jgi:hypothetical protein
MPLFNDASSQQVITSASVPSNPTQGLIWNELDSNNNFLESWNRINNQWISFTKQLNYTTTNPISSGSYIFYFPVPSNVDLFLCSAAGVLTTNVILEPNNTYISHHLEVLSGTIKISDNSDAISYYNNSPANTIVFRNKIINKKYSNATF